MKFPADENVPRPIIDRLREDGWGLLAMSEIAPGERDAMVIAHAASQDMLLLTQDRDFGELAISRALPVAGVILIELERLSLPNQIEHLSQVLLAEQDNLSGQFTVVEPGRIRRRPLPHSDRGNS